MKKIKKYMFKFLIVFWCLVIFTFSNMDATESGNQSSGLIRGCVDFGISVAYKLRIIKEIPLEEQIVSFVDTIHTPVRKLAHSSVYFVLCTLILLELSFNYDLSIKKRCIIAILFCFLYSLTDEFHQTFVPGRSGELKDCLIDTLGASISAIIFCIYNLRKK